jgi:hypothetical protein
MNPVLINNPPRIYIVIYLLAWLLLFILFIIIELYILSYNNYPSSDISYPKVRTNANKDIINVLNIIILIMRSFMILFSLLLLVNSMNLNYNAYYQFANIILPLVIPIYLMLLMVKRFYRKIPIGSVRDSEKIVPHRIRDNKILGIINLIPLLFLILFLYYIPWPNSFYRLGFAIGMIVLLIFFSLLFLKLGKLIGLLFSFIFLSFVFISYFLPTFDQSRPSLSIFLLIGFVIIFISSGPDISISYTWRNHNDILPLSMLVKYHYLPSIICLIPILLYDDASQGINYSSYFVIWQIIGWLVMLISLRYSERRQRWFYNTLRDRLVEKGLESNLRKKNILIIFILFLLISTLFEAFRGLWLFWALTACWISLMFVYFWKFWQYAFIES